MAWNPTRAKNFYRNTSKRPRRVDAHAGTKHSDIVRRQGVGNTVPGVNRYGTGHGFASDIFSGEDFVVRSEVIAANNAAGFGHNDSGDRVYKVLSGQLYAYVGTDEGKQIQTIQPGGSFRASRGLKYSIATSTEDVEVLIIESKDYEANWVELEHGVATPLEATTHKAGPAEPTTRRADQTKAKTQAVAAAQATARRRSRRGPAARVASGPTPAVQGGGGVQTQTGAQKLGKNTTTNANSSNVTGVSPMPGGPGAFRD